MSHRSTISMKTSASDEKLAERALAMMGIAFSHEHSGGNRYVQVTDFEIRFEHFVERPRQSLNALGLKRDASGSLVLTGDAYGLRTIDGGALSMSTLSKQFIQCYRAASACNAVEQSQQDWIVNSATQDDQNNMVIECIQY